MKIIKTINNNTVCVVGKNGKEQIVSGKGIGFGKKCGDYVDPKQIQKTYFITSSSLQNKLIELMSEIPYEYIKFTDDMIAMHIVSARLDTKMSDIYEITKMLNGCIEIAEYFYSKKFDRSCDSFERFMVHLKYLSQRLLKNHPMPEIFKDDKEFTGMIRKSCTNHYKCAEYIQEYIQKKYNKMISEDELITLTIHLKKISSDC